jgi:hypothetical protein
VVLGSAANPSSFGMPTDLTATVTALGETPTGSVTFYNAAQDLGTAPLSNGVATLPVSSLAAGSHNLTAVYSGDSNLTGSTSSVLVQTVEQAATTIALGSSANPSVFGAGVTLTANVQSLGIVSGGTVQFFSAGAPLGTAPLSNGVATLAVSSLTVGSHNLTAVYNGDSNFVGSTSPVFAQIVEQASTAISLTSSVNPGVFGQDIVVSAQVQSAAGVPGGEVTFYNGGVALQTRPLNAGAATLTLSGLAAGSYDLTVSYGGDTNFTGSTSPVLMQAIGRAATTLSIFTPLNPSDFGQLITLTAEVEASVGVPGGSVEFLRMARAWARYPSPMDGPSCRSATLPPVATIIPRSILAMPISPGACRPS